MLTEEAHHMFVGQTGVRRVIKRACELMNEHKTEDIKKYGAVPLSLIQKYVNFWYSSSLDLFGNEKSTNAATYFAAGLKGRAYEAKDFKDHVCTEGSYSLDVLAGDRVVQEEIPLRSAMNEVLRDAYVKDNENGVSKWNLETKENGIDFQFVLPSRRFHRTVGQWSEARFDPKGNPISEAEWDKRKNDWLPTEEDRAFIRSLMQQVTEPGKIAGWIAPPNKGINDNAFSFEYVKL
jgi:benzoyl-CoA 2,3-dioxygenase component B